MERRRTARIRTPLSVTLRAVGAARRGSDLTAVVDDIGAGGFYVRVMRRYEPGARLSALVRFAADQAEPEGAALLAVRGVVLRAEELPGGAYGLAVGIKSHRFI